MNRLLGKFAGQVANVADPKKLGRVKALVEGAGFSTTTTPWAFPSNASFKGAFAVPEVGDNVWVEFENGDPNRPVWSPGFYSEPQGQAETPDRAQGQAGTFPKGTDTATTAKNVTVSEPSDPFAAVYPKNRVVKTGAGHLIEIDDTPGAERLHVWAKGGSFIEFHRDGKVVMKSAGNRYVYVIGDDVLHASGKLDLIADTEAGIATPELTVKATSKVDVDSQVIELGVGTLLNLIDERIINLYNAHTHQYNPGPGALAPTGVPVVPLTKPAVATTNTKAS